jgi:DNA-binding beta-propeller fold protein YncE
VKRISEDIVEKKLMLSQFILAACLIVCSALMCSAQALPPLKLVQTIPMPQVKCHNDALNKEQLAQSVNTEFMPTMQCHFDRFGLDPKGGRLFTVAENDGTIEVYAISSGKLLHSIAGFGMSHNVVYRSDANRIYATDGNHTAGFLRIFDGTTYQPVKTVKLLPDTDSMDYDAATHYLYITNGGDYASLDYTLLSIVNTDKDELIGDIKFNVGRLEHMVMEKSGSRLFITSPNKGEIDVIDRSKRAIAAAWPVTEGKFCVAVDLDEADHRLFVACRSGTLNVMDTETGKAIVTLPISKGTDDLVYDPGRKRIYITSAEGFVEVFHQSDSDHYDLIGNVPTGPMGKNLMLVSSLNRLYVAVPPNGNVGAKLLVYEVQ